MASLLQQHLKIANTTVCMCARLAIKTKKYTFYHPSHDTYATSFIDPKVNIASMFILATY